MRNARWQPVRHRRKSFPEMLIVVDVPVAFINARPRNGIRDANKG